MSQQINVTDPTKKARPATKSVSKSVPKPLSKPINNNKPIEGVIGLNSTNSTKKPIPSIGKSFAQNLNPAFNIENLMVMESSPLGNSVKESPKAQTDVKPLNKTPTKASKPALRKASDVIKHLDKNVAREKQKGARFKTEFGLTEEVLEIPKEDILPEDVLNDDSPDIPMDDLGMEDIEEEAQKWEESGIPLESYDFAEEQQHPTNTPDGVLSAMSKHFTNNNILHKRIFGKSDGTPFQYPETSNLRCHCRNKIESVPIFIPVRFDEKTSSIWFFDPIPHCSLSCAVDTIYTRRKAFASQCMGLLCRFAREYFGYKHKRITHIPITMVEGFCNNPVMTYEEYQNGIGTIRAIMKQANCLFVETFAETEDIATKESKEEQKKKDLEKMINTKPSEQQGKRFENMMEKTVDNFKNNTQATPVFESKTNKPKHQTWN
jgi:hypothetical protein